MNKIVALIVNYNSKESLTECIDSILAQDGGAPDILVVDNASTDGTKEYIKDYLEFGQVRWFELDRYLGYAGGYEHGVREAVEMGYKFIWFVNVNCRARSNALKEFKKTHNILGGHYGFLVGRSVSKNGSVYEAPMVTVKRRITNFNRDLQRVEFAPFLSCFIQTGIIKKVSLPIGEFFAGVDDIEYTRRISLKYPCYYVKESVVVSNNYEEDKYNIANVPEEELMKFDYEYRNKFYVYKREGTKGLVCWFLDTNRDVAQVVLNAQSGKGARLGTIMKGTLKGFFYRPTIDMA